MAETTSAPDITGLDIVTDVWTQPFWDGTAQGELLLPRCDDCGHFRWPPGPFCPECNAQTVAWVASGPARIYSYTVLRKPGPTPADPLRIIVPALVEFPACAGVRFMAPIVDTAVDRIHIGAGLVLGWSNGVDCKLPVFTLE